MIIDRSRASANDLLPHSHSTRNHWFYRVHELQAFAPSDRPEALHEALASTDRGWPLLVQVAIGLLWAFSTSLILLPQDTSPVSTALAIGGSFGIAFLVARRENVRRHVRRRLSRRDRSGAQLARPWSRTG